MKIFGVGMNYREHNKELARALYNKGTQRDGARADLRGEMEEKAEELDTQEAPVIFTKCDSALLKPGNPFFLPAYTKQCEYETELVVRIGHLGRSIAERWAYRYIDAVTVGIDFTARDLQREAARKGQPWTLAKGFDGSAAIGEWVPIASLEEEQLPSQKDAKGKKDKQKEPMVDLQNLHFHLDLNGKTVQTGFTGDMIHSVYRLVSYISQFCMLKTGDIIYTGTPAGVGPVHIDDHLEGYLEGRKLMEFNVK